VGDLNILWNQIADPLKVSGDILIVLEMAMRMELGESPGRIYRLHQRSYA
jgi:hypothetical protein